MNTDTKETQEDTSSKTTQTAEDILRLSTQDREEFERVVLENPVERLKGATIIEAVKGMEIVDRKLQKDHIRTDERQRKNREIAQQIITYKTGKNVEAGHEAWSRSTGLTFREVLWQRGLVPREYLPTRMERLRGSVGSAFRFYVDPLRNLPKSTRDSITEPFKESPRGSSKPTVSGPRPK